MAEGYYKKVNSTAAVAPTISLDGLFTTNYQKTVDASTKYQQKEVDTSIDLEEYMDINITYEPHVDEVWYKAAWNWGSEVLGDIGKALASTYATVAVGTTSVLSGILDVGEAIFDGATWLVAGGAGILGFDDAAKDMRNFIARDLVGEANEYFYENTAVGKAINDASALKYDSDLAQGIRSTTEKVTVFAAATAATVLTGGGAAAIITPLSAGFLYGTGEKAEATYQANKGNTSIREELGIFVNGVGEAANWYAQGKLGEGLTSLTKVVSENGVKATASAFGNNIKTTFTNVKNNGFLNSAREMLSKEQIVSNLKKSLLQGDNISDSIGIIGDNVADWLNGDEEFNFTTATSAFGELIATMGLNVLFDSATDYLGALNDISSITIEDLDTAMKNIPTGGDYVDEAALFGDSSSDKKGFLQKMFGGSSSPSANLTTQERLLRDRINASIRRTGGCAVTFNNTTEFSSALLRSVDDLSNLSVRINGGFNDLNGNYRYKYQDAKYINRITYTGHEALAISDKLDELTSRIDMSLPTRERAKQIYEVLASEVSPMYDHDKVPYGNLVSQSLRGLTDVNPVGRPGLICAGYSQAYKELCTRCGIQCDYVRGLAYGDILRSGKPGGHAWNVVIDGNTYIPVDVTWHACGSSDNWFNGSEAFIARHIADADEYFQNFSYQSTITEKISQAIGSHDAKYGTGTAITQIEKYLNDGNINHITSSGGAREIIRTTPISELQTYVRSYRENQTATYIINTMINKFGYDGAMNHIQGYINTGDINYITRTGGARDYVQQISIDKLKEVLGG